jgi:hypothetical protein
MSQIPDAYVPEGVEDLESVTPDPTPDLDDRGLEMAEADAPTNVAPSRASVPAETIDVRPPADSDVDQRKVRQSVVPVAAGNLLVREEVATNDPDENGKEPEDPDEPEPVPDSEPDEGGIPGDAANRGQGIEIKTSKLLREIDFYQAAAAGGGGPKEPGDIELPPGGGGNDDDGPEDPDEEPEDPDEPEDSNAGGAKAPADKLPSAQDEPDEAAEAIARHEREIDRAKEGIRAERRDQLRENYEHFQPAVERLERDLGEDPDPTAHRGYLRTRTDLQAPGLMTFLLDVSAQEVPGSSSTARDGYVVNVYPTDQPEVDQAQLEAYEASRAEALLRVLDVAEPHRNDIEKIAAIGDRRPVTEYIDAQPVLNMDYEAMKRVQYITLRNVRDTLMAMAEEGITISTNLTNDVLWDGIAFKYLNPRLIDGGDSRNLAQREFNRKQAVLEVFEQFGNVLTELPVLDDEAKVQTRDFIIASHTALLLEMREEM